VSIFYFLFVYIKIFFYYLFPSLLSLRCGIDHDRAEASRGRAGGRVHELRATQAVFRRASASSGQHRSTSGQACPSWERRRPAAGQGGAGEIPGQAQGGLGAAHASSARAGRGELRCRRPQAGGASDGHHRWSSSDLGTATGVDVWGGWPERAAPRAARSGGSEAGRRWCGHGGNWSLYRMAASGSLPARVAATRQGWGENERRPAVEMGRRWRGREVQVGSLTK
jgi:hypothetical protein